MSMTLHTSDSADPYPVTLTDKFPDSWKWSPLVPVLTLLLGFLFAVLANRPLHHTDVYGHLSYGEWILQQGKLPATEPFLVLANGVPLVDSAWLTQVGGYLLFRAGGYPALQFAQALLLTLALGLWLVRILSLTRSPAISVVCILLCWTAIAYQASMARPQTVGFACFAIVLFLLTARRWHRAGWVVIPAVFAIWANSHGSFPMGLALLGGALAGRMCDHFLRCRPWAAPLTDRILWRSLLLCELAFAATLVNPYGLTLYREVLGFASNGNLEGLPEWQALDVRSGLGQIAAALVLALAITYRLTPRRVRSVEVVWLVVLGAAALWSARMFLWWVPVAMGLLALNISAILTRNGGWVPKARKRASLWTVITIPVAAIFVMVTPLAIKTRFPQNWKETRSLNESTPVGATRYLLKNPPQGLVFNTYEWGDYLHWAGPKDMKIFLNSHAHLLPREVWESYFTVANGSAGWESTLNRYGVNTVVVDHHDRRALVKRLSESPNWTRVYDDSKLSVVFVRKKPI